MKKLFVVALMAFSFMATARTADVAWDPTPQCFPCPDVR